MSTTVIIGAQWGDEGKGKVVDAFAEKTEIMVRFHGGNNAGHTLVVEGQKKIMHLLPVGIVRPGTLNIVGPYVVVDPEVLLEELIISEECGSFVVIDESTPVILPIHKLIDGAREKAAGKNAIGTTKRGIGPAYEDFWSRRFIKLGDLTDAPTLLQALKNGGYYREKMAIAEHLGEMAVSVNETVEWGLKFAETILPYLGDTRARVARIIDNGGNVLFEGAQGIMLDGLHGARPYCTSSFCSAAAVSAVFGVYDFGRVVGVAKAYATRVGGGPFPTELDNELGEEIRAKGGEFGATTGRPRRCGWLDLSALRYGCRLGGIRELAITKLDVISGMEKIQVCAGYTVGSKKMSKFTTLGGDVLHGAIPIYETLPGWKEDISGCRKFKKLPANARSFINFIENYLQLPVSVIGTGPEREQIIWR